MNEKLFQFIWQYSLYKGNALLTDQGEAITVHSPGRLNKDSGPDFFDARITIGNTLLAGNVELHLQAKDWLSHGHQHDAAYKNVILHVVYEDDDLPSPTILPQLVLKPHIPEYVVEQYTFLLHTPSTIPCAKHLHTVPDIIKESMLQRCVAERWEMKLSEWQKALADAQGDWRQLLYETLAYNFGFKVNAFPFHQLAKSLPLNIIARHKQNITQLEALLFGQSGLLQAAAADEYVLELRKEYEFLKSKYSLQPLQAHQWKFLRMRPANFPSVRLAQFAQLLHQSEQLFTSLVREADIHAIRQHLDVQASPYWDHHFVLGKLSEGRAPKKMGMQSINNLVINTMAPIRFLYAFLQGDDPLRQSALQLLETVPPEKNAIIQQYAELGWRIKNASQSQGMLHLFQQYCQPHHCLECSIGLRIIKAQGH